MNQIIGKWIFFQSRQLICMPYILSQQKQTPFLTNRKKEKWYTLWLYCSSIFLMNKYFDWTLSKTIHFNTVVHAFSDFSIDGRLLPFVLKHCTDQVSTTLLCRCFWTHETALPCQCIISLMSVYGHFSQELPVFISSWIWSSRNQWILI